MSDPGRAWIVWVVLFELALAAGFARDESDVLGWGTAIVATVVTWVLADE